MNMRRYAVSQKIIFLVAVLVPFVAIDLQAQSETAMELEEVIVLAKRDEAGLVETQPSDLFGIEKSLLETGRSASFISSKTLDAYGVTTVDDLTAVAPGTYTASFYGVEGALNVRGTLAETYFHGFKRIENRGTYQTPIGASSRVDILRGPPTVNFGPGKIGGLLNLEPMTSSDFGDVSDFSGEFDVTLGSYGKKNSSLQFSAPLSDNGGLDAYIEVEDSESFYRGLEPEHQMLQLTADFDLSDDWELTMGLMAYNAEGYTQIPGWNRITEELIADGTYITGRDTDLVDTNGNGQMEWAELSAQDPTFFAKLTNYPDFFLYADSDIAALDTDVGTTTLSTRDVYISDADFSETTTLTSFIDLIRNFDDGRQLKMQLFTDSLDNQRFVSYGFPADYDSKTIEARISYITPFENSAFNGVLNVGYSGRMYDAHKKESFNGGQIALDRRDISSGATANDIMGSPFNSDFFWDLDTETEWSYNALFAIADIEIADFIDLSLSGRYDYYDIESVENGDPVYSYATNFEGEDTQGEFTYSATLMLDLDSGVRPYVSYAETAAIEFDQAGDVAPDLIVQDEWLSEGELMEAGVKFDLMDGELTGSVAAYRQDRTELSTVGGSTVNRTRGEGVELELRYLATDNLSFTLTANKQKTTYLDGFDSYHLVPPSALGLDEASLYGTAIGVLSFSDSMYALTGSDYYLGELEDTLIPESVVSLYGSYVVTPSNFDRVGTVWGIRHVSESSGLAENAVTLPDYFLLQGSFFIESDSWELRFNIDNVLDETYFTALQNLYGDVAALPGKGREYRASYMYKF